MQRLIVAVLAASVAALGTAVASARADVLDYGFDPGTTAIVFGQTYDITGDFGFDRTSNQITFTNADAKNPSSGDLHLTSATATSPSEVVFDDGQNDRVNISFARSLASATTDPLLSGTFSRGATNYGPIAVSGSVTPTAGGGGGPEPSTWALMMVGVFGAGAALRRRQGQRPSLRAA